ncbi:pimeloyl-ACP methyl ester carboxylesterase [Variovorax boronicumulans]|uniref:alpha/beta fold hydrolase n=1 Tax=Variovorax boronicumulans TaxID=436515 RepID=UPI00247638C1|nr:alpha/beta hydrolase [Variovorax boronicumulans]MDH6169988.1 pimeloyl-ACP methyl ester carboxylesterase [Variovorax boronicumulans]
MNVTKRFILPDCTIEYERRGDGVPMVVLHPSSGVRVTRAIQALSGQFSVYQPIFPGFDGTVAPAGPVSVKALATWVAAFLSTILDIPAILVGHSFGGWVAAWVALTRPELVGTLILQSPLGFGDLAPAPATASPAEVLARTYSHPEKRVDDARPEEMLTQNRTLARSYGQGLTKDEELIEQWPALQVPTLVLYGENDGLVQRSGLEAAVSRSSTSVLKIVQDAAHHIESDQPKQYVDLIAQFVARKTRNTFVA